jgi:trans-feruloyl-CoA hydratase/vanillin synthase
MLKKSYTCVEVEQQKDGITWVTFNRPEKRNAMSPTFHIEMMDVLTRLETDPDTKLVILTGAGTAYSAGQDLKEYFRETDGKPDKKAEAGSASRWRSDKLWMYSKPTIAMVNGYCIGGAWTHCICADFAVASNDAVFCLSEVNWGILPGGMVSKFVGETLRARDAMFYACTGRTFDGKKAAEIGLVNLSVPHKQLRKETLKLAKELLGKNQNVLRGTKHAIRAVMEMDWNAAADYLNAKGAEIKMRDAARGHDAYAEGIRQFIDEKKYKPVFSPYIGAGEGKSSDSANSGGTKKKAAAARAAVKTTRAKKAGKKTAKKVVAKKVAAKKAVKAVAKKTVAKKTVAKKTVAKKAVAKKTAAKKTVAKKSAAKKTVAKKVVAKKTVAKKSAAKKTAKKRAAKK